MKNPYKVAFTNATDLMLIEEIKRRGWHIRFEVVVPKPITTVGYIDFRQRMKDYYQVDLNLTKTEIRVFELLLTRSPNIVRLDALINTMYFDRTDGGPLTADKVLQQAVCKIRKGLVGTPYTVNTEWGVGYELKLGDDLGDDLGYDLDRDEVPVPSVVSPLDLDPPTTD